MLHQHRVGIPDADIMGDQIKRLIATELFGKLIEQHCNIGGSIGGGNSRLAQTWQVWCNDGEAFCQRGHQLVPLIPRLSKTMHQINQWARSAFDVMKFNAVDGLIPTSESIGDREFISGASR